MDENKYTADDLRGMLDEYSPEQQMENDAKIISEGAKALADMASVLKDYMARHPKMIEDMCSVNTLWISDESRDYVVQAGKDVGIAAANAFKVSVEQSIEKARRKTNHVSIPAPVAYCLLLLLIALIGFFVSICVVNYGYWQNHFIWRLTWYISAGLLTLMATVLFLFHKGWLS
jgi:hypothetical protein